MRAVFELVAGEIERRNYRINRNSYRLNIMLTVNIAQTADQSGDSVTSVQSRVLRNLRNLFRSLRHEFAGIWRREAHARNPYGEHLHILFHAPRGMRATLMRLVPLWLDDPVAPYRTSKRFDRPNWRVGSTNRSWQLERVYGVSGALDYVAKVPLGRDEQPMSRPERLDCVRRTVREYGNFGVGRIGRPIDIETQNRIQAGP